MVNPGQVSKIILRASSLPDAWPLRKPLLTSEIGMGGTVASWLVCSTPDRAVQVQALARDIVLCSWAKHFTPTVPLSTQVYKWVPGANLMLGGVTLRWTSIPSRGSRNTRSRFMLQKPLVCGLF